MTTTSQLSQSALKQLLSKPLQLQPDNFTPPKRTPWGGRLIRPMKADLGVPQIEGPEGIVGESWEISGHPKFPNRFGPNGEYQLDVIGRQMPELLYGPANVKRFGNEAPFLTKLLNAAANLSVQIHPDAEYAKRNPKWHSKTEMWVVLAVEHGAGFYLGLKEGITQAQMADALKKEQDVSEFLNFVEVFPDDVFVIPAGTPHAIGEGILLLEQQETSETTFRYYDWGKLYDGKPRELHIEDAVSCTNWGAARGIDGVNAVLRREPVVIEEGTGSNARHEMLANEKLFSYDRVVFDGGQIHNGDATQGMHGLTITEGQLFVLETDGTKHGPFLKGQSLIIPAAMGTYRLTAPENISATVYIGRSDSRS